MNILLGICGGIAAYKSAYLASALIKCGHTVETVMTAAAENFITPLLMETITGQPVATCMFADKVRFEVEHIALAKRAQLAVLAPATANSIAKLATGTADNMLTSVFLALKCPIIIIPAMNSAMFENPATQANLSTLMTRGYIIMQPSVGKLACGEVGVGRMPEPEEILEFIKYHCGQNQLYRGKRLLITAGPTREPIDPVRYISNRSSGKMGYALAHVANEMGAQVTLVSGPVALMPPSGVDLISIITAEEMKAAVLDNSRDKDAIIMCAAVADYTPRYVYDQKIKKKESLTLELIKTPDILYELGKTKQCTLIGFAAETDNLEDYAKIKLKDKNLDMIVANDVSSAESGFENDCNSVIIITKDGERIISGCAPKIEIARLILKTAYKLLN